MIQSNIRKGVDIAMEKILSVTQLEKSFKHQQVLTSISFDIYQGEIMAILGPNGAGKSTTIRNIMGIMQPDQGDIHFANHSDIPRNNIGYLPEERGLYQDVTIMDMLLYLAELKDYPLSLAKERAKQYLKKLDLAGKEQMKINELSKGMSQKVQFIASIIHEPEFLILDEPFSGLDPVSQELFKKEIRHLANQGTAILLSSHQMNVVEEVCDRLFMMQQGKKVIYGTLDEVKAQYANFKCTIRGEHTVEELKNIPGVQRVERDESTATLYLAKDIRPTHWLKHLPNSLTIHEMTLDRISLHEIFIDIATNKEFHQERSADDA